jgi:hypothetical protein
MDQTALVGPDVAAGKELVEALGTALQVEAAFWWMEDNEWRLVLATPLVHERGPIFVDSRVRDVIESTAKVPRELFDRVEVVSPSSGVITVLYLGGADKIPLGRLILNQSINSVYIASAYFYEFQPKSLAKASQLAAE